MQVVTCVSLDTNQQSQEKDALLKGGEPAAFTAVMWELTRMQIPGTCTCQPHWVAASSAGTGHS